MNIEEGKIYDRTTPQPGDDLVDYLDAVFADAKAKHATLYLFGEKYDGGGNGIHQAHQNQGNYYITTEGNRIKNKTRGFFWENGEPKT